MSAPPAAGSSVWVKATPPLQFWLASCLSCREVLYLAPLFWRLKLNHAVSARAGRSSCTVTDSSLVYGNS